MKKNWGGKFPLSWDTPSIRQQKHYLISIFALIFNLLLEDGFLFKIMCGQSGSLKHWHLGALPRSPFWDLTTSRGPVISEPLCSLQLSTQGTSGLRAPASSTEGQNARLSTHWPHGEVIVPTAFSQGPPWKCAWYLLISHSPTSSFISVPSKITLWSLEVLLWACVPFLPGSFTLIFLLSCFVPELINPRCSSGYEQGFFS